MNHVQTSFSTEIFAGAIISVVQYLAPLRYAYSVWVFVACVGSACLITHAKCAANAVAVPLF
jgi:hypothetical protein